MPRPKRSPEEVAAMREAILNAAARLLYEGGPEALSIRAIAEKAGVSHMVLYRYFANRQALLDVLRERQRARLAMRRESALREAREGDVVAVMRRALGHYGRMAEHHPRMYRFIWVEPVAPGEGGSAPHSEAVREDVAHIAELIAIGIGKGVFTECDTQDAALLCIILANAPLILYYSGRLEDAALRDRLAEQMVELALDYLQQR